MNLKYPSKLILLALVGWLAAPAWSARADGVSDKAREVFKSNASAVVTLAVVVSITAQGNPNERKVEVSGTVVDPSGLTVLALSSVDPSALVDTSRMKFEIELNDIKIMLEDGSELAAEVVLRDKDLDLAFVRPKTKPAKPMVFADPAKSGTAQVLDEVLTVTRLGKAAGRAHAASIERISAVVTKPRLFYIPDSAMTNTRQGSPAFTLDGKMLGVFVYRAVNVKGGSAQDNISSIILPAEEILKSAKQAPEAKGESEKKDAPKEEKKEDKKDVKKDEAAK